jgi:D-alanyl-D-alanine carboxypeptidase
MAKKPTTSGTYNDKYDVWFDSLVSGGFYSSEPDKLNVKRAVRTNNPGALNISKWQKSRPGYVGATAPDKSKDKNRTTIYRTPEHGVAAWYFLLSDVYRFKKDGFVSVLVLATKYAGGAANGSAVKAYLNGWKKRLPSPAKDAYKLASNQEMLVLARAMFAHEIGKPSPLSDTQIRYGIRRERDGTLPK